MIDDLTEFDAPSRRSAALPASGAQPGRLRPRMDLAITIGQGLGFGVACGLSTIALLVPLFWPGIDGRALGALGAPGLVLAAVDVWLPQIVRILLRVAAGAAACEFWLHDDLAWAGLAIGGGRRRA